MTATPTAPAATTGTTPPIPTITTVAGTGIGGYGGDNGPATTAQLHGPSGVAVDSAGALYIGDAANHRVRKVTLDGVITTVAGTGTGGYSGDNGPAISAQLYAPYAIAVDSAGTLYIADYANQRVRKVTRDGMITTMAGTGTKGFSRNNGPATTAELHNPDGVAVDSVGALYIAEHSDASGASRNHWVRIIRDGMITTVAGTGTSGFSGDNGPATSAQLSFPAGVAVDSAGTLYIADRLNHRVRKVTRDGVITTVAGTGTKGFSGDNGPATSAELFGPWGVAVDSTGTLYIADTDNHRVRMVRDGMITTVAGTGTEGFSGDNGPAISAELYGPRGVAVDSTGTLYIADTGNQRLRRVTRVAVPVSGTVGTFVNVRSALLLEIYGESLDEGAEIYQYTDNGGDHQRWQLTVVDQDSGHDVYTITNVGSGKVIEVVEAQTEAGAIAVQRTYGGEDAHHQQWTLIPIGPDTGGVNVYKIMNRKSGLVLDAETDTATVIKQYGSWDDDGRQRWRWSPR